MLLGGIFVIKEGYFSVQGILAENIVPGPLVENKDGTVSVLEPEPCFNCGSTDLELITNEIYEPALFSIRCTKCLHSVPVEMQDYAYFSNEGFINAVKTWNCFCTYYHLVKSGILENTDLPASDSLYQPDSDRFDFSKIKALSNYSLTEKMRIMTNERIRAKYWEERGIEPEETYPISLSDMSKLYPVKNYPDSTK